MSMEDRFEEWWKREGKSLDPDTSDVSWYDKRKGLAMAAFAAATYQGRNFACDKAIDPTEVTFGNDRRVRIRFDDNEEAFLQIENVTEPAISEPHPGNEGGMMQPGSCAHCGQFHSTAACPPGEAENGQFGVGA